MFVKLSLGAALATILVASPALAASAETVTVTADRNEVVCKSFPTPGSRIGNHRVCMTRTEWDAHAKRGRDNLVRVQDQGLFVNNVMGQPGG